MKIKSIITIMSVLISSVSTILIPTTILIVDRNNLSNKFDNDNNTPNKPNQENKPSQPEKPEVPSLPPDINTTYFKNSVDIIDNPSTYSMAKPGGGYGNNSLIPSTSGPIKTTPSEGVPEYAKINGKYLFNEIDIKHAKRTVGLWFNNGAANMGTGWILDYKLTNDNSYPLTWYFATNAHVIQNLRVKGDVMTPERYDEGGFNTSSLIIRGIKDPQTNKEYSNSEDDKESFFSIFVNPKYDENKKTTTNLKTIFIGNDYLKTSPKMFSNHSSWTEFEEYIDFAVLEVTFDNENDAKQATHEYANFDKKDQFKYKNESLLKNQSAIIPNGYKTMGFPNVVSSNGDIWNNQSTIQLFSSTPELNIKNKNKKGTNLATSPYYNTFKGKKGAFDAALALSFFGYDYRLAKNKTKFYRSWGLSYPVDYGCLEKGSSGSMLMDENGYTIGIHFAGDNRASMGLAQALYCEGFSYNGAYGDYNLEGYDLIKGGFPNQQNSYLDSLKQLYNNEQNFKTNLFPNGLNSEIRSFE